MASRIKKFNELTKELQKTIEDAKFKLLNAIINDNEISKVEKLRLIDDNNLFTIDSYICHVFDDQYKQEYLNKIGQRAIIDDWFHMREYNRHETVNLADVVENIEDDEDDMITIFTNRSNRETFEISKYEFIDTAYDWCIKNKCIGFQIDW